MTQANPTLKELLDHLDDRFRGYRAFQDDEEGIRLVETLSKQVGVLQRRAARLQRQVNRVRRIVDDPSPSKDDWGVPNIYLNILKEAVFGKRSP